MSPTAPIAPMLLTIPMLPTIPIPPTAPGRRALRQTGRSSIAPGAIAAAAAILSLLFLSAQPRAASAAMVVDVPGYEVKTIRVSNIETQDEGPALAADPINPWVYSVVDVTGGPPGSYQGYDTHQVWRLDFSADPPTTSVFSAGAYRSAPGSGVGDDVLDSVFGSIGGIAVLADGSLILTDNFTDSQGRGDTIYRARDLNSDGDALDVVDVAGTPTSETLVLIAPIDTPPGSGYGGFAGVQVEVGPDGNAYITTSDGGALGEILRVDDPTSATPSIHSFCGGLGFGSGLAFDSTGRLYAGNLDFNYSDYTSTITVYLLDDADHNGVIGGAGESTVVSYDQLSGLYDLAVSPEGEVFLTGSNEVRVLNTATGTSTPFAHDDAFTFLSDLVFFNPTGGFAPFSGPGGATLIVADPNSDGLLAAITPAALPPAGISDWNLFR